MTPPVVSVLIPTFNCLPYLRHAVASVSAQTYRDFEIVVVDDGSADGTARWLARRATARLRWVRLRRNGGVPAARNVALKEARGEFVAWLDHDDLWRPGFLRALLPAFRRPEVMVATSNFDVIDARGLVLARRGIRPARTADPVMRIIAGLGFIPLTSAAIVRRTAFETLGGFDALVGEDEDLDFWYRVGSEFGAPAFHFLNRTLVSYRRHAGQITAYRERAGHPWRRRAQLRTLSASDQDKVLGVMGFTHKHRALLDLCWGLA